MLIAGAVALGFGLLEFWLNTVLFPAVFAGNYGKTALCILAKFAGYGVGIGLLILKFKAFTVPAAIGFGAGFLVYMVVYTALKIIKKDG